MRRVAKREDEHSAAFLPELLLPYASKIDPPAATQKNNDL